MKKKLVYFLHILKMEAEYYSDKSIAVYGETKPWAANLRTIGGKFNYNLRGKPGWIFPRSKEAELMQFIGQANAGQVQAPQPTYQVAPAQMAPFGATQAAMSPRAALTTLQAAQPIIPLPTNISRPTIPLPINIQNPISPGIPRPSNIPIPMVSTPVNLPRPVIPTPVSLLPQKQTAINYPNLFTAADNLQYQIIMYTVPLPSIDQGVSVTFDEDTIEYVVSTIESTDSPFDSILISRIGVEEEEISRAVIVNGKWQVIGLQNEHTMTFHQIV